MCTTSSASRLQLARRWAGANNATSDSRARLASAAAGPARRTKNTSSAGSADARKQTRQPVAGAIEVYTDEVDLSGHILNFHHIAIAVRGGFDNWLALLDEVRASGDEFAFLCPAEPTPEDKVCFCYVDTRKRLGHYTEFLWIDEALKPMAAMPDLDA